MNGHTTKLLRKHCAEVGRKFDKEYKRRYNNIPRNQRAKVLKEIREYAEK